MAFCVQWLPVQGEKKRRERKLAAILSGVLLALLLLWMILYPVSPVLTTQIFVVSFTFVFCIQIATVGSLGFIPRVLIAFIFTWTTTLVYVSFQNTVTVDAFSQNIHFGASITVDGSVYVSGRSPVNFNNVTEDLANGQFAFLSAPYLTLGGGTEEHVTATNGATLTKGTTAEGFFIVNGGAWVGATMYSGNMFAQTYVFQDTGLFMLNATSEEIVAPLVAFALAPGECVMELVQDVTANTFLSTYKFLEVLPTYLDASLSIESTYLVLRLCNQHPTTSLPIGVGDLSFTFITMIWGKTTSDELCTQLNCDIWCLKTQAENACINLGCCF